MTGAVGREHRSCRQFAREVGASDALWICRATGGGDSFGVNLTLSIAGARGGIGWRVPHRVFVTGRSSFPMHAEPRRQEPLDLVVAQGRQAGGHLVREAPLMALLPAVVDAAADVPMIAVSRVGWPVARGTRPGEGKPIGTFPDGVPILRYNVSTPSIDGRALGGRAALGRHLGRPLEAPVDQPSRAISGNYHQFQSGAGHGAWYGNRRDGTRPE